MKLRSANIGAKFVGAKFAAKCAQAMMMCSVVVAVAPAYAAPQLSREALDSDQTSGASSQNPSFQKVMLHQPVDLMAARRAATMPRVVCDPQQSQAVCDVRHAAARRALEVVTEETVANAGMRVTAAPSLLIPFDLLPVAIACDPALSTEECAKLERRIPSNPPGPLPPTAPPPPVVPVPPPVNVPEASAPPSAVDPVPVTPPSVIPPPPTGDDDLVKRPPKTGSQMPVVKPKVAPPVNPQPE